MSKWFWSEDAELMLKVIEHRLQEGDTHRLHSLGSKIMHGPFTWWEKRILNKELKKAEGELLRDQFRQAATKLLLGVKEEYEQEKQVSGSGLVGLGLGGISKQYQNSLTAHSQELQTQKDQWEKIKNVIQNDYINRIKNDVP